MGRDEPMNIEPRRAGQVSNSSRHGGTPNVQRPREGGYPRPSTLDPRLSAEALAKAEPSYYIVTFPNTHLALKAERIAKEAGIRAKMIPVPRYISSDCNMGMRVAPEHKEALEASLKAAGVECAFVEPQ